MNYEVPACAHIFGMCALLIVVMMVMMMLKLKLHWVIRNKKKITRKYIPRDMRREKETFCFWNGVGGAHSRLRSGESKKQRCLCISDLICERALDRASVCISYCANCCCCFTLLLPPIFSFFVFSLILFFFLLIVV